MLHPYFLIIIINTITEDLPEKPAHLRHTHIRPFRQYRQPRRYIQVINDRITDGVYPVNVFIIQRVSGYGLPFQQFYQEPINQLPGFNPVKIMSQRPGSISLENRCCNGLYLRRYNCFAEIRLLPVRQLRYQFMISGTRHQLVQQIAVDTNDQVIDRRMRRYIQVYPYIESRNLYR